jgi:hypothetical protein
MTDTGPPYPPLPVAGSNAVGQIAIGEGQIGSIPPFVYWTTVISQYANSPILTQLVANFDSYIDQTQNFDGFYGDVWNIATAHGYGLDVWGRIVGINRIINFNATTWFGFAEAAQFTGGVGITGFNQGPFYSGQALISNYALSDETFRNLILTKAAFNITDGSIPAINRMLMGLFPNLGNAYVTDGPPRQPYFGFAESTTAFGFNQAPFYDGEPIPTMTMQYVFTYPLTPLQLGIVESGVLPKPVGVLATVEIINPGQEM